MAYRLLDEFRAIFDGTKYVHRDSSRGDWVALHLVEDLYALNRSRLIRRRVDSREHVMNRANKARGIKARRGDGTFGELVPGVTAAVVPGFVVARGQTANVEIGTEVKILQKAMIKQIDRVMTDLGNQVAEFQRKGNLPICVGIVGINAAEYCVGYEGDRAFKTNGKTGKGGHRHPCQEAQEAERRIREKLATKFDELIVLRYKATNEEPYPFEWVNAIETERDYAAALLRISRTYDNRFSNGGNGPATQD